MRVLVDEGPNRRAAGVLAMNPKRRTDDNPLGFVVFLCDALVLAAGGPGELYRDSVYPRNCFGSLGLALEAGIEAVNLTESQFGIGTSREGFPLEPLGHLRAVHALCLFARRETDASAISSATITARRANSPRTLFARATSGLSTATRMLDFGSSLFDLAVFRETQAGRRVFLDFNRNPLPVPGDAPFSLDALDADVRAYLEKSGALLPSPIDRLRQMNPLSIELYKRYKRDITREPLEFAVNNQHMNGGLAVNAWGETSLAGCYAVGEAAGTHGVTRPGGAALNAGQVFGTRCAEHISARIVRSPVGRALAPASSRLDLSAVLAALRRGSPIGAEAIRDEVQGRMSDYAGIVCKAEDVEAALAAAEALNRRIGQAGVAYDSATEALRALQWRQMAIASEAVLAALAFYVGRGGGSRGARTICDPHGGKVPQVRLEMLEAYRFRPERPEDRGEQILVRRESETFEIRTRLLRAFDQSEKPFFERNWPDFLTGAIYGGTV